MAVSKAPLWLRKATLPGFGVRFANVASSPITGFMMPRQLGPITRVVPRFKCSRILFSSSTPSAPRSRKPAEITTTALTAASTHSPMMSGTVVAGVTTMAKSSGSGRLATFENAGTPSTSLRFGLTA